MIDLSQSKVSYDVLEKLPERLKHNKTISKYYSFLADEKDLSGLNGDKYERKSDSVNSCCSVWDIEEYEKQRVKSVERLNLCRDKFCVNCQNALANKRYNTFSPIFVDLSKDGKVYHVVFTVENPIGDQLRITIETMFNSFSKFIKYLKRQTTIKGLKFGYMGYTACIRALEVTYNFEENTYHPHLHCLFSFSKDLYLDKVYENAFSHSKFSNEVKLFSAEEVLFQKIWFLLNTGKTVNLKNIDNVNLGYSVKMNEAKESDYKEVFKYALKSDLGNEDCMSYECFKVYESALKDLRFIQGYGKAYDLHIEDTQLTLDDLDDYHDSLKRKLGKVERPKKIYEDVKMVIKNVKAGETYIMSKSCRRVALAEGSEDIIRALDKTIKKKNKKR